MSSQFVLIDNQFSLVSEQQLTLNMLENRLFTEHIRAIRNHLPFWTKQLELILLKFKLLNQPLPEILKEDGKELKRQLERTLVKNKLFRSALIHIYFFRKNKSISYLIRTEPSNKQDENLNSSGLKIELYDKIRKSHSILSVLDLGSAPFWEIVRAERSNSGIDELLLLNAEDSILEAPGKNIYALIGNTLLTPAPKSGAYLDPSQQLLPFICDKLGLELLSIERMKKEILFQAEELFLVSTIQGVEWIKAFRHKRYFNKATKQIHQEFNKQLLV
ncbi:aminotransferase class IV [Sunxiuqinia sp. sy24]|uniref:aminotransferase class IV n=1 Tax=Sunxiuqinia sp. sy24 TaxID=3461495 RepID=UPI00404684A6